MKIVQVSSNLRINNPDRLNWNIEALKVSQEKLKSGEANPKAGEETWKTLHHYPKLEYACMKCMDIMLSEPDEVVSLEAVRLEILVAQSAIIEAVANMTEKEAENKTELITEAG